MTVVPGTEGAMKLFKVLGFASLLAAMIAFVAPASAFTAGEELAKGSKSELLVLHVLNPMVPMIGDRRDVQTNWQIYLRRIE